MKNLIEILNNNGLKFRASNDQSGEYYFQHPSHYKTLTILIGVGVGEITTDFEQKNSIIFSQFKLGDENQKYELNERMELTRCQLDQP
ncbi:hypothetical protein [Pseudoalteromonas sp. DY56-GL79]|uniref:hypothetical protein n=1 Tax=Pseudoalteromonas sp. DY56-GL79 TaxID=2967131 RepID=UPI00352AE5BB